jgi:hypothetical protein
MSTYSGNISFSLPNDTEANELLVYSGVTESGAFSLADTIDYTYPTVYTSFIIDDSRWYKIAFNNTNTGITTPISEPVSGSGYIGSRPVVTFGDGNDGVAFASIDDVYRNAHLTESNVSRREVQYCIEVARAHIDNLTSTNGLDRYSFVWDHTPARRKYNAKIKLLKEVEINLATSMIYKNLADDAILKNSITNTKTSSSVAVGQTSIGGITGSDSIDTASYLDQLSTRYANYATGILSTVLPTYIPLRYSESGTGNGFVSYVMGAPTFSFSDGLILDRMDI